MGSHVGELVRHAAATILKQIVVEDEQTKANELNAHLTEHDREGVGLHDHRQCQFVQVVERKDQQAGCEDDEDLEVQLKIEGVFNGLQTQSNQYQQVKQSHFDFVGTKRSASPQCHDALLHEAV
jgi:hypothetical protein